MQELLAKIIEICKKNNISAEKINEKRLMFIHLVCNDIVFSNSLSDIEIEKKIKKIFPDKITFPEKIKKIFSNKNESPKKIKKGANVFEQLEMIGNILVKNNLNNFFLDKNKKFGIIILTSCLSRNINTYEKMEDKLFRGIKDFAFSNQDPWLAYFAFSKMNSHFKLQDINELFKKVQKANQDTEQWYKIITDIPKNNNLLKDKDIIIEYLNKILSLDDFNNHEDKFIKVIDYFKNNENFKEITKDLLNKIFDNKFYISVLKLNSAITLVELYPGSPSECLIKNQPIIEFLYDLSSTNQMFQQIISICIEKDKEIINNAIKNDVKISTMKKRI